MAHLARRLCIAAFGKAACRPQLPPVAANPLFVLDSLFAEAPIRPGGAFGILGEAQSSRERWITGVHSSRASVQFQDDRGFRRF
jgi:hypothetical protein